MGSPGYIDREKHEVDVAEHVLAGGVRAERGHDGTGAYVLALDGRLHPWPFGVVASAVQVQVLDDDGEISGSSDQPRPGDDPTPSSRADHGRRR